MTIDELEGGILNDSILNEIAHIGDARDKQAYTQFMQRPLARRELEEAYASWLPHKVVRIFPDDMIREGRTLRMEKEDVTPLKEYQEELEIDSKMADGYAWGRLYGGGAAYIIVKNDDPRKPLDINRISAQNPVTGLLAFDRYDVSTTLNTDPRAPNYLRPEWYRFAGQEDIHWTRVLGPFDGYKLPNRLQQANSGWGGSEVERVSSAILQALSANAAVVSLMHRAEAITIGVKGLLAKTANRTKTSELVRRFETAALLLSNSSIFAYDKDSEEVGKISASISIGTLISEFMSVASSAVGVPVSRFFGTPPKGLNATGEGDREDHQAVVASKQRYIFGPQYRRLDPLLVRSVYSRDILVQATWNPLEQLSDLEKAQTHEHEANAHSKLEALGAILPSMIARELQASERYAGITEEFIAKLEKAEKEIQDSDIGRQYEVRQTNFGSEEDDENGSATEE